MASTRCLGPVAIHGHTAVTGGACGLDEAPVVLVATLP
jgi:hypothetical protein